MWSSFQRPYITWSWVTNKYKVYDACVPLFVLETWSLSNARYCTTFKYRDVIKKVKYLLRTEISILRD